MHTKEHLAALIPWGPALMLNTIRWASEIRPADELKLPAGGKAAASLKPAELKMATQLIKDMTGKWKAEDYTDSFSAAIHKLVNQRVKAGKTKAVTPIEDASPETGASNVLDLTALLARSLAKRKPGGAAAAKKAAVSIRARPATAGKKTVAKLAVRKRA
jgi:DNA end-binding protein Ku